MLKIQKKVQQRLVDNVKKYQGILKKAQARDVNESDTVTIIVDMLTDIFGYDKYSEVTSEHAIRGTYCDIAVTLNDKLKLLVEAKAIDTDLNENHIKQAVDYAANQGVEWVVLTTGLEWQIYKVIFAKPIEKKLAYTLSFPLINVRKDADLESLFLLCKEGLSHSAMDNFYARKQITNKYNLSAILLTDPVLKVVKKELKQLAPDIKIEIDEIKDKLLQDVLKRELVESEEANAAAKLVARKQKKREKLAK